MQPHGCPKRTSLLSGVAIAISFAVLPVGARPASAVLVTSWDYTAMMVFVSANTTFTLGAGVPSVGPNAITWGVPTSGGGPSAFRISNSPVSGIALTNGPPVAGPLSQIVDNPIANNSATLAQTTLQFALALSPLVPALPGSVSLVADIPLAFAETPDIPPCLIASLNPCPDILVVVGGIPSAAFTFMGQPYVIQLVVPNLQPLPALACVAAAALAPCEGFATEENGTIADPDFRILRSPVPVPATLMVVGLGLLGLRLARHRR